MQAVSVDKVELITTPPANLDAEGNAGFINIVLLQTEGNGVNGSFFANVEKKEGSTVPLGGYQYQKKQVQPFCQPFLYLPKGHGLY